MHMPIAIHPLVWIKSLGYHEDDHTCPWCGETFSMHFCESAARFQEAKAREEGDEPARDGHSAPK